MASSAKSVFDTTRLRHAKADAEAVAEFLSRTGYDLPTAVADIIDNSIDARATRVQVSLVLREGNPSMVAIADDGHGMEPKQLEQAASLSKDPRKQDGRHLGRYGAGLKAASFSLGRMLYIASRTKSGDASGVVLDRDTYRRDYEFRLMSAADATSIIETPWGGRPLGPCGTVILIGDLVSMVPTSEESSDLLSRRFNNELDTRLGIIYHRYITSQRLIIGKSRRAYGSMGFEGEFAAYDMGPVDPFGYPVTGYRGYPKKLVVKTGKASVPVRLHLWPKQGRTKDTRHSNYEILGRSTEWQGLYYYRWDRLLQTGGWNGLRSVEPHLSYARIAVDLPHGSDDQFRPTVMKDRIENPRPLLEALMARSEWSDYITAAQSIARGRTAASARKRAAEARAKASPKRNTKFLAFSERPSVRIVDGQVQLDRRLVTRLGRDRAAAVADLVWLAVRDHARRTRLSPEIRAALDVVEGAVAQLAGRGTEG